MIDWALVFQGFTYIFALLGLFALGFYIYLIFTAKGTDEQEASVESQKDRAFRYLDNEIRGQFRTDFYGLRGSYASAEPTLKARVDMIEKHLGIETTIKDAEPQKVVVKKVKKS